MTAAPDTSDQTENPSDLEENADDFDLTEGTSHIMVSDDHVLTISGAPSVFDSVTPDVLGSMVPAWTFGLAHLVDYTSRTGALPGPGTVSRGFPLGRWVQNQQRGHLPLPYRAALLAVPGMDLTVTRARRPHRRSGPPRKRSRQCEALWIREQRWARQHLARQEK